MKNILFCIGLFMGLLSIPIKSYSQVLWVNDSTEVFPGFYLKKETETLPNISITHFDTITFQDTLDLKGDTYVRYRLQYAERTITKDYIQLVLYRNWRDVFNLLRKNNRLHQTDK